MNLLRFLIAILMILRMLPFQLLTPPEPRAVTMTFVGDCTISTMQGSFKENSLNWYTTNHPYTYFLEKVEPIFSADDITVVNCETTLSDRKLPERDKGSGRAFWFTGPTANAKIFSSSSVEVACFANNHMDDYGPEGVEDTIAALEAEDLLVGKQNEPLYVERNGMTVSILACQMWSAGSEKALYPMLQEMVENSDFQIIYPHGGAEGTYYVEPWRTESFHNLIDRGADLIIGLHAHLIQPIEKYNGGTIVYGLGNFCFGGNTQPNKRTAIYQCTVKLTEDGFELEDRVIPCWVYTGVYNNWQPCPVDESDPAYTEILDYMWGKRDRPQ